MSISAAARHNHDQLFVYQAVAWSMRPPPDDMSPVSTPARS